jgi:hypothetical protein
LEGARAADELALQPLARTVGLVQPRKVDEGRARLGQNIYRRDPMHMRAAQAPVLFEGRPEFVFFAEVLQRVEGVG